MAPTYSLLGCRGSIKTANMYKHQSRHDPIVSSRVVQLVISPNYLFDKRFIFFRLSQLPTLSFQNEFYN
jgi:hypothetical protein